jgi:hypothetical protein
LSLKTKLQTAFIYERSISQHNNEMEIAIASDVSAISQVVGSDGLALQEKLSVISRFMAFLNPFHQQFAEGVEKFREMGGVDLVKVRRGLLSKIQYLKGKDGQDKGNNDIDLEDFTIRFHRVGNRVHTFFHFIPTSIWDWDSLDLRIPEYLIPFIRKW